MSRNLMLLKHYFDHSFSVLRRSWLLTALIIAAIGLGIGASMTMITVLHVISGDPMPERSGKLFYPHLDPGPAVYSHLDPGINFTWPDANSLLHAHRAVRQAAMVGGRLAVMPEQGKKSFFGAGHYVSNEFFAMFDAPFSAGSAWDAQADEERAPVVVLNGELARKLYGNAAAAVGQTVRLQGRDFQVIGVLRDWHPEPLFYGGRAGDWAFKSEDGFFLPLSTAMSLKLPTAGGEICWGAGGHTSDQCTWLQFWIELDTPAQVAAYKRFLADYWLDQKAHGRALLGTPPQLLGLMHRLDALHLVPPNVGLQVWLAVGFLCVCLFNTVCLMLAKFLRRSGEISIRRAMGASRADIFLQFGIEAAVLGLVGGALGLVLTRFGLWLVHQRPDAYAKLAHLDFAMVFATVALAILANTLAGLLPAWRACRIQPASQLHVS